MNVMDRKVFEAVVVSSMKSRKGFVGGLRT